MSSTAENHLLDLRHILIVDDDADFVDALVEILDNHHYDVIVAHSKKQALEKIQQNDISVAILDLQLPDSPGMSLISSLKERNEHCACIILTGHANLDSAVEALKNGAFHYIQKPVNPEELLEILDRAYNIIQLKEEKAASENELIKYRDHLEELVQARTSELEVANKELEAFCYSVSHDLRSPLRAIHGFSNALKEDYQTYLDDNGIDFLSRIEKATLQMEDLIENLLSLSRMTQQEMKCKPVSLSKLAEEICQQLDAANPDRDMAVTIQPNLSAYGDEALLKIALENLLGNAYKFTSNKHHAYIEFGSNQNNDRPGFFIKDNGVGFSESHKERLFIPFQRLHSSDEFPGSGIGLATVQRIIHRHGGRIWAEPGEDEGAVFYFSLPHRIDR